MFLIRMIFKRHSLYWYIMLRKLIKLSIEVVNVGTNSYIFLSMYMFFVCKKKGKIKERKKKGPMTRD